MLQGVDAVTAEARSRRGNLVQINCATVDSPCGLRMGFDAEGLVAFGRG